VDVNARETHVHRLMQDGAWDKWTPTPFSDAIAPLMAPALAVRLADWE
jgi:hypothetical protein